MRRLAVLFVVFIVAGCGGPDGPNVSPLQLSTYRLEAVEVRGEDVVRSWPAVEHAFIVAGHGSAEVADRLATEPASNFPALRAEIKQVLEQRLLAALKSDGGALFIGQRPVVAQVTVVAFDVPSAGRQLLVSGTAGIKLRIDLVDAKSKAVVVSYPGQYAFVGRMGGVIGVVAASMDERDVGDELIRDAVRDYIAWLKGSRDTPA